MGSMVLGDSTLESLPPSVNAPLVYLEGTFYTWIMPPQKTGVVLPLQGSTYTS